MMIDSTLIKIIGTVTSVLCVAAWWRYKRGFASISGTMFLVLAGLALSVTLFYIAVDCCILNLPLVSRWIWLMFLASMAFMAISVLVLKKGNGKNGRR